MTMVVSPTKIGIKEMRELTEKAAAAKAATETPTEAPTEAPVATEAPDAEANVAAPEEVVATAETTAPVPGAGETEATPSGGS